MSSVVNRVVSRVIPGTGADKPVRLGFKPKRVVLFNADSKLSVEKDAQMPGLFAKTVATAGTQDFVDDVIQLDGDGFTINASAAINVSGESIYYTAWEGRNE